MKTFPYPSYLRTHRDRWCLTQPELGRLLGGVSASQVSRYERLLQEPNLHAVIAAEFIFEEPARHLFPGLFGLVESRVVAEAAVLRETLAGIDTETSRLKTLLLDAIAFRGASDQTTI